MIEVANMLASALGRFYPEIKIASSGSVYIYLSNSKVKCVRVANHNGRSIKPNVWELRTDAMTSRKNPKNRIYNIKAVNSLIMDIK